jgi:hypothetical protein
MSLGFGDFFARTQGVEKKMDQCCYFRNIFAEKIAMLPPCEAILGRKNISNIGSELIRQFV